MSFRQQIAGAAIGLGVLFTADLSQAQEVVLRFASFPGPTNFLNTDILGPWFQKLEEESGGKLKVEFLTGGSAAAPTEVFDTVEAGLVDMGWSITSYNPGRFPAAGVTELPLLATGSTETSAAIAALYDRGLVTGFEAVKVVGIATADIARLHHAGDISGLSDFKRAKVRAAGSVLSAMITAVGATPVGMPAPAIAEGLSKNVVDAAAADWFAVKGFSLLDVTRSHVDIPLGTTAMYVIMNQSVYDGLPADIRKVFDENPPKIFAEFWGPLLEEESDRVRGVVETTPGHKIITPTDAEMAEWKVAADKVIADWVAATPNGAAVLDAYKAEISAWRAKH
ncbi:TRAP transporter substrate-binding protein [Neoaquamicrobium sediminum]|uniref:TRAP transporter substrate-binding protein n=1 Tax=Neoaquamicrobium sediminum TaxID=1849104 RepID=UPI00156331E3|nr:TRAP transporter substrate-binding protein [Mesorhizobium sediminum]NRC57002.1 TRAP transporter substrate-binding protein [Mesorhizobium sediminum]